MLVGGQAARQEHDLPVIHLLPVNLYGPRDNFDLADSHVIPALIKKIDHALTTHQPFVEVWGDGSASREFLYVEDAAEAIVLATEKYDKPEPVNVGCGKEIKIKDLVEILTRRIGYGGEIRWDASRPSGQPRRCLDTSLAEKEFGFKASMDFELGLNKTISWYREFGCIKIIK